MSWEVASGDYLGAGGPRGWVYMPAGTTPGGDGSRQPLFYRSEFNRRGWWGRVDPLS